MNIWGIGFGIGFITIGMLAIGYAAGVADRKHKKQRPVVIVNQLPAAPARKWCDDMEELRIK